MNIMIRLSSLLLALLVSAGAFAACTTDLFCNISLTRTLGCEDPALWYDTYYIPLRAGQRITVAVNGVGDMDPAMLFTDATFNTPVGGDDNSGPGQNALFTYTSPFQHLYIIIVSKVAGESSTYELSVTCDPGDPAATNPCVASQTTLCLHENRFRVNVFWRAPGVRTGGIGHLVPVGSGVSSAFWFFSPENWELLVKVIDGCAVNDRWWVYSAATTDVEYTMTVSDTRTGMSKLYHHEAGTPAPAITDSNAFSCP